MLSVGLPLMVLVAVGCSAEALLDGALEREPARTLATGFALVGLSVTAASNVNFVWRALTTHPLLVLPIALLQLAVAAQDGGLASPFFAYSLTAVGLAVVTERRRVVWSCVALQVASFGLLTFVDAPPAELARRGELESVLTAMLAYPAAAVVLLAMQGVHARFLPRLDARLDDLLGQGLVPAVTPGIDEALRRANLDRGTGTRRARAVALRPREREAAEALALHGGAGGIARVWSLEKSTVEDHLAAAKRQTGARTLPQLAALTGHPEWPDVTAQDGAATVPESGEPVRRDPLPASDLTQWGAELVAIVEFFHVRLFSVALVFTGAAGVGALLVLPLRDTNPAVGPAITAGLAVGTALLTALAVKHSSRLYNVMNQRLWAQLAVVLAAAVLVAVVQPLRSQLWWLSCALLAMLAFVVPRSRALAYCVVALCANLVAHIVAADLGEVPARTIIGLWVGFPFWTLIVGGIANRLGLHVIRRCMARSVMRPRPPDAPRRRNEQADLFPGSEGPDLRRLTARDIQIFSLLAAGYSNAEILGFLSMNRPATLSNQINRAVARSGATNKYDLVRAVAVAYCWQADVRRMT